MILASALIAATLAAPPRPAWDRAQLADALERMIVTGEPRHVDHDEGEDLQAALTAALANADPDFKTLATRAAVPIVAQIARPLFTPEDPGSLEVRASRVLTLPWTVTYTATLEARVPGGQWRRVARVTSGQNAGARLDRVFPRAWLAPGFHDVELRARLEYTDLPEGVPREETRPLPSLHYGVGGAALEGRPVMRIIERGRFASVARLDAGLPDVPLAIWLMQLPYAERGDEAHWTTQWCTLAAHPSGEGQTFSDVCAIAMVQAPQGIVAEVWVKIADLVMDTDGPHWRETDPSLEGAFLRRSGRAPVRLALLPTLAAAAESNWPMPALVVRPADLTIKPAAPRPGQPVALSAVISNNGTADALGVTIELIAGSTADDIGSPVLHRRFVRDIPAGGQVELTANVSYPAGYGWIMAHAMLLTDHAAWPVVDAESPIVQPVAIRIVNAAAAPSGYSAAVCQHAVARVSCGPR